MSHSHNGQPCHGHGGPPEEVEVEVKQLNLSEEEKAELDSLKPADVAYFLRKNCATTSGIAESKRVEYFRGSRAGKVLMERYEEVKKKKHVIYVMSKLMDEGFFHAAEEVKSPTGKKSLRPVTKKQFTATHDPYIWMLEVGQWKNYVLGSLVIIAFCFFILQPLWPPIMRDATVWVFYGCLSLIGLLFGLSIIRLILFLFVFIISFSNCYFWLYPNLFVEEEFWASFVPLYSLEFKGGKVKEE